MYIPFWSEQKEINKARKEMYETLDKLEQTVKRWTHAIQNYNNVKEEN